MTPIPAARATTAAPDDGRAMRRMGLALAALTALGIAFAAQPVFADPPGGVPPGLAKKGVSKPEWERSKGGGDARDGYVAGGRLPSDGDYVIIRDYDRYGLDRPPAGYDYYLVDGRVMRVSRETMQIAAVIGLANALLD